MLLRDFSRRKIYGNLNGILLEKSVWRAPLRTYQTLATVSISRPGATSASAVGGRAVCVRAYVWRATMAANVVAIVTPV